MNVKTLFLVLSCGVLLDACATNTIEYNVKGHFISRTVHGLPVIALNARGQINTQDGGGNVIGHIRNLKVTLAREYNPDNTQFTHVYVDYNYTGYPGTQGGSQQFTIDLLDSLGNLALQNVYTGAVPRGGCYYGPGLNVHDPNTTTTFDFVGKDVAGIRVSSTPLEGAQGGC